MSGTEFKFYKWLIGVVYMVLFVLIITSLLV